jgi:hypothetical protein
MDRRQPPPGEREGGLGTREDVGVGLEDAWTVTVGSEGDRHDFQRRLDALSTQVKPCAHRRLGRQRHDAQAALFPIASPNPSCSHSNASPPPADRCVIA